MQNLIKRKPQILKKKKCKYVKFYNFLLWVFMFWNCCILVSLSMLQATLFQCLQPSNHSSTDLPFDCDYLFFYLTIQLNLVVFCNCIKNNFCCVHSINLVRIQLTVPHPTPQIVLFIIYYSVNYSPCTYICFTLLTSYSM